MFLVKIIARSKEIPEVFSTRIVEVHNNGEGYKSYHNGFKCMSPLCDTLAADIGYDIIAIKQRQVQVDI